MTRFDATGRRALWTSGQLGTADLTTSPQAQQQQQKRSIHMVHKPVNSVCYRHPGWAIVSLTRGIENGGDKLVHGSGGISQLRAE